jgi:hypothetical protein
MLNTTSTAVIWVNLGVSLRDPKRRNGAADFALLTGYNIKPAY